MKYLKRFNKVSDYEAFKGGEEDYITPNISYIEETEGLVFKPEAVAIYDKIFGTIPPESTSFGWPLYITVPFIEENDSNILYEKEGNDITSSLFDWIMENKVLYEDDGYCQIYRAYPDKLFINGQEIAYIEVDYQWNKIGSIRLFFVSDINDGTWRFYEGSMGTSIPSNIYLYFKKI